MDYAQLSSIFDIATVNAQKHGSGRFPPIAEVKWTAIMTKDMDVPSPNIGGA